MSGKSTYEWQIDQPISLFLFCSRETNTFLREGTPIADPSPTHPLLAHHHFSIPFLFKRENTPSWEGASIADTSPTHPLLAHHHFSLPFLFKREKTSYIHHIGHSRNEWQIDIWVANRPMSYEHTFKEIYSLIVHGFDFSDQRPYFTTTHLETTTTWYFISHRTSHFQHSARHHPHPLLQQPHFLPRPSYSLHSHYFHSTCREKKWLIT